jgi:hypothetical protein
VPGACKFASLQQQGANTAVAGLEAPEQLLSGDEQFLRVRPRELRAEPRPGTGDPASRHLERDAHDIALDLVLTCHRPALPLEPSHQRGGQVEPGDARFEVEAEARRFRHPASITPDEPSLVK